MPFLVLRTYTLVFRTRFVIRTRYVYFVWSVLMLFFFKVGDNCSFTLVYIKSWTPKFWRKISQLIRVCFSLLLVPRTRCSITFLVKNYPPVWYSRILLDTMFVGVLILWGKFKLWSVLGVIGFIIMSPFSAYFT